MAAEAELTVLIFLSVACTLLIRAPKEIFMLKSYTIRLAMDNWGQFHERKIAPGGNLSELQMKIPPFVTGDNSAQLPRNLLFNFSHEIDP